jgi:serine/threonine protein kinase
VADRDTSIPVSPGDLVAGKYRVDRVLGAGGMGVVLAATHEQLDQPVALKFLHTSVLQLPEVVQRFMREARSAVKIHSEHVARVLDVGALESGAPYMVMEYLDGQDIAEVLAARGALPAQETVGYVLQACEAIAEAHSLGIVHRDLKPANLFLARRPSGKPTIKVLDFGISKVRSSTMDHAVTKTSALMGSPGYMSPEQMVAAKSVDARSDIWSIGVLLYEMLSHRMPFLAETMPELVAAILQKVPDPIGTVRPDLPVGLQVVVTRCLEKDPAARYANVAELARALVPFGPARGELSVERIEQVLGLSGELAQPMASAADAVRNDPATFLPTTTHAARQKSGRFVVPAVVLAVGVTAALGFGLRASRRSTILATGPAAPQATASATASIASTPATGSPPGSASDTLAPPPAPTTLAVTAPAPIPGRSEPRPRASAPAPSVAPPVPPSTSSATPAPSCSYVSYFDPDGTKRFKQVCR